MKIMNQTKILLICMLSLPLLCFASTGDSTFMTFVTAIEGYMGGSLGLSLVLVSFLGACIAVAGMASMKLMFSAFGLAMALHFGPGILEAIFGATGEYYTANLHHVPSLTSTDMVMLFLSSALFIIAYFQNQQKAKKDEQQ